MGGPDKDARFNDVFEVGFDITRVLVWFIGLTAAGCPGGGIGP